MHKGMKVSVLGNQIYSGSGAAPEKGTKKIVFFYDSKPEIVIWKNQDYGFKSAEPASCGLIFTIYIF